MAKAIRFHRTGGPEALQWEAVDVGPPGPGEVLVRHHAVGLNFAGRSVGSSVFDLGD